MAKLSSLKHDVAWKRLTTTKVDWNAENGETLARMLEQLFIIRRFEEKILDLKKQDLIYGPAHASIGQDGAAVGAMSALRTEDKINGSHRMHHQFLAKVLNHVTPGDYDPRKDIPTDAMQDAVTRTLAEIMGLESGFCGGRGGSMHLRYSDAGVLGSNAIVGANVPHAVGYALAEKINGNPWVSVAFFGDGAAQGGAFYEAMNLAAVYNLPVIFFIDNNMYAVSTHITEQTRETRLSARGLGLGIPGIEVDGTDVLAVRKAMQWALDCIENDRGPVLIDSLADRHFHHSGPLRSSAFGYREKVDEESWLKRDPMVQFPKKLIEIGVIDQECVLEIDARASKMIDAATKTLVETLPGSDKSQIKPALWPDPQTFEQGFLGDLGELINLPVREAEDFSGAEMEEVKLVGSISTSLLRNMEKSEEVLLIGEDVHRLRGGTDGTTKGILEKYPDRLIGTPICENGFVGMALGAALNGLRPVVEIMYSDFCLVAADQLFNQISKVRHMFGGDFPVPIVVRSRVASRIGYGSQHCMDVSALFSMFAGWRIVAPSTPFDYCGLMNAAIQCDDPVLVLEHGNLYQTKGLMPTSDADYIVPFGAAKVVRPGSACTVLTYLTMVSVCVEAAENSGIDAEIIDLRTLDRLGMDWALIEESVRRTNRVLIVEETTRMSSLGAAIIEELQLRCFDWLDHEIMHTTGANMPPVVSRVLEELAFANQDNVISDLKTLVDSA